MQQEPIGKIPAIPQISGSDRRKQEGKHPSKRKNNDFLWELRRQCVDNKILSTPKQEGVTITPEQKHKRDLQDPKRMYIEKGIIKEDER